MKIIEILNRLANDEAIVKSKSVKRKKTKINKVVSYSYSIGEHPIRYSQFKKLTALLIKDKEASTSSKFVYKLKPYTMKFKEIKNKESYLKKNGLFDVKLTDKRCCLHCGKDFIVGDYKVMIEDGVELIVCPNAPDCDGNMLDWVRSGWFEEREKSKKN